MMLAEGGQGSARPGCPDQSKPAVNEAISISLRQNSYRRGHQKTTIWFMLVSS